MDHARRGGRTPGVRGSRLVTEGCSAAFEGGELAKRPKGCEPFASGQSVRGCTSAPSLKGLCCAATRTKLIGRWGGRSKPAPIVLPRRAAHGAHVRGNSSRRPRGKRWGILHLARGTESSKRARRRSRGCARTLYVSFLQKSTGGLGSEKPFPQYVILRKRDGDRGGRGPGLRMYRIVPSRVRCHRRPALTNEALRCEATRGGGSRRRRQTDSRQAGCATPRSYDAGSGGPKGTLGTRGGALAGQVHGAQGAQSPSERTEQRAAHLPSNEGALDREKLRRVTAAGWKRSRRASPNR